MLTRLLSTCCLIATLCLPTGASALEGRVLDARSNQPVADALVTAGRNVVRTDALGMFRIDSAAATAVAARAPGYGRATQPIWLGAPGPVEFRLTPILPKALYLTFYGIGDKTLRGAALDLIGSTEANALVIDFKGDRGMVPFKSTVALTSEIGAQRITTVRDMRGMVDMLRQKNIYLIARIVVFKDDLLATAHPELAVRRKDGTLWRDREQLAWVDPFRTEVWNYNLDLAAEAAALGFDEIQFDYVRFPDASEPVFSRESTEQNRVDAITGFLAAARQRLAPFNVFVAADIFGYVCWNLNDTHIGQRIEALTPYLDYISPMLYPSGFQYGIPGYDNPVAHPQEIVALSLKRAGKRSGVSPLRFRPWLQAFRDYAFDRRPFTGKEVRQQIDAAESFGSGGWMLWNPRNDYSNSGLRERAASIARP